MQILFICIHLKLDLLVESFLHFLNQEHFFTPNGASFSRKDISKRIRKLFVFLEKIANRMGGQVVCVSRSEMESFRQIGITSIYINNGIPISEQQVVASTKEFVVITVGRITHQKNPKSFNELATKFIDFEGVKFVWVGDGELRGTLISENIEITGWLNKDQVFERMKNADVYLSTALWEGLPFAVLEAMTLSLPLVLLDAIGNQDLVRKNINGFLFREPTEGFEFLKMLKDDQGKRQKLGNNSFKLLQESFDVDQMIAKYDKIYSASDEEYIQIINEFPIGLSQIV